MRWLTAVGVVTVLGLGACSGGGGREVSVRSEGDPVEVTTTLVEPDATTVSVAETTTTVAAVSTTVVPATTTTAAQVTTATVLAPTTTVPPVATTAELTTSTTSNPVTTTSAAPPTTVPLTAAPALTVSGDCGPDIAKAAAASADLDALSSGLAAQGFRLPDKFQFRNSKGEPVTPALERNPSALQTAYYQCMSAQGGTSVVLRLVTTAAPGSRAFAELAKTQFEAMKVFATGIRGDGTIVGGIVIV